MQKSKFAIAAVTSSCTLLSLYGYQRNEALGTTPVGPCSLDYTKENAFSSYIMRQSQVTQLLQAYKPSWFYATGLTGNAASLYVVPLKEVPAHETLKVRSRPAQGGFVCYDILRATAAPDSKKVLFIVPGVNSSLADHHINATVRKATAQGFHCVIVNPVRPDPKKGIQNLEVIDYSKVEPISESIETIKEVFGADCQIFALGFSLGSNHLLRHLGAHKNCKDICGITAAVSISGAYEVRANACALRTRVFGLYDWYMRTELQKTFLSSHFKATSGDTELLSKVNKAKTLTEFDTLVRAPIFGYRGASRLFRQVSCDAFVSQIETPLLAVATKDDSITDFRFVPVEDLRRNPNVILAVLERGGHCDLFFQNQEADGRAGEHQELAPLVALEFFSKSHDYFSLSEK